MFRLSCSTRKIKIKKIIFSLVVSLFKEVISKSFGRGSHKFSEFQKLLGCLQKPILHKIENVIVDENVEVYVAVSRSWGMPET